jgi:tRNA dimethylallyltransferase
LTNQLPKTVIIVAGPTASGKTRLAIEAAKYFKTEIISADSRQCYKELNIGVARPSPAELNEVPHHFIASHSIHEIITAAFFELYALTKCAELFPRHDVIIMAGGTGLYLKAFCDGLDRIPEIDPMIRQRIMVNYEEKGIGWLTDQLNEKDPVFTDRGEMKNPQRMMRALEVVESTGHSILSFRKTARAVRDFNIVKFCIDIPREQLISNINSRIDRMFQMGLLEEVSSLLPYRHLNALQTVGYTEVFEYLENKIPFEKAVEQIRINTRQYAKRQLTWFRKEKDMNWVEPGLFMNKLQEFYSG